VNASTLDLLLLDLEEEFSAEGTLPLHDISWNLAGLGVDRTDPTFAPLAREAYTRFRAEHPDLVLARGSWPDLLATAGPALDEDDAEVDLDPRSEEGTPILFLVAPHDLPAR
jgi:hypothetical protein